MGCLFWVALFIVATGTAAYFRFSLAVLTALLAVVITGWAQLNEPSAVAVVIVWALFLAIFIPLHVTPLRRLMFSNHVLRIFRKVMPTMSQTESDALEAGTVWWDGGLFSGRPNWKKLLASPVP